MLYIRVNASHYQRGKNVNLTIPFAAEAQSNDKFAITGSMIHHGVAKAPSLICPCDFIRR